MKPIFRSALLFCILTASYAGLAQTVVTSVHLRKEQGLSDRVANLVIRDSIGFFYISTDVGIMRYDGREFVPVNTDDLFTNNIDPSSVKSLSVCPNGMILIRTDVSNVLSYIEPGGLIVKTIDPGLRMEFLVSNNKLYGINPKNGTFDVYNVEWNQKIHLKNLFTSPVYPDNICRSRNTYIIESGRNIYTKTTKKPAAKIDKKGKILENENGIFLAADRTIEIFENGSFRNLHGLRPLNALCTILKSDKKGHLIAAYGSRNRFVDSIYILDKNRNLSNYSSLIEKVSIIKDLYTDDAGHMWMLAGHHGLTATALLRDGAVFRNRRPYLKDETFGSVISGIATDHKSKVLYAVENQDLILLDIVTGRKDVLFKNENDRQGFINNGKVYFDKFSASFYMFGYVFDDNTSVIYHFNKELNSYRKYICPFNTNDFLILSDGRILVAGQDVEKGNGILYCIDENTGRQTVLINYPKNISSVYYNSVNDTYWVGTYDGLLVLDKNFKQIHKFDPDQSAEKKYMKFRQVNVIEPYRNLLVVGVFGGGAYFIDPLKFEIKYHLDHSKGLSDEKVVGAVTDNDGHCWLPTFNGITVIDSNYNILNVIYGQDGLPDKELNTKAYTRDINGKLYFGTINGMVELDPAKVIKWQKSHGFYIGQPTAIYRNNTEVISLNAVSDNFVSLRFNYLKPDYIYNLFDNFPPLVNTDKSLYITSNASSINIHTGKSGSYNMKISFPGVKKEYNLPFVIRKDYTRWGIFMMVVIVCGLLYQIYKLQKKNKKQKENAIRSRISILELEALQSQMNPHFLFNALGSIQYFIQTENIDKADDYLSDFAQLMRMILESSHNKFIPMSHEIKLLQLYISLEQIRFNNKFDFEFKIGKEVDPSYNIPPMLTQPFIENAINHGLNNLNGKRGHLEIKIDKVSQETLSFIISDNGIGRTKSALKSRSHKSRGTQIVKERVETLNETNYFNVQIDTTDLIEGDNESGTRVSILFHDMKNN